MILTKLVVPTFGADHDQMQSIEILRRMPLSPQRKLFLIMYILTTRIRVNGQILVHVLLRSLLRKDRGHSLLLNCSPLPIHKYQVKSHNRMLILKNGGRSLRQLWLLLMQISLFLYHPIDHNKIKIMRFSIVTEMDRMLPRCKAISFQI